jgi:polyvinyl alcohol dehydrogenase (cytochrome)
MENSTVPSIHHADSHFRHKQPLLHVANDSRRRKTIYAAAAAAIIVIIFVAATAASGLFVGTDHSVTDSSTDSYSSSSITSTLGNSSSSTSTGTSVSTTSSSFVTSTTSSGSSSSSSSTTSSSASVSTSSSSTDTTSSTSTTATAYADGWVTYHGDNTRDGSYSLLSNVTTPSIAWNTSVDAAVYAEPLAFNGSVFVATENDTVYSLSATTGAVVWSMHLGTPANSSRAPFVCNGNHPTIYPLIGITGTPVIDPVTGTIYAVALINDTGYRLFALNTNDGQVRWSTMINESGLSYTDQEQRGALTLANGLVYVPFGGYSFVCTGIPFGWIVAYSFTGNGTSYSYKVPSTGEADIWAPEGLSVDSAGFIYAVTADSTAMMETPFDYGSSVLKLTPELSLVAFFAPTNYLTLDESDLDLDTTGATLLPGHLVFSIGKEGVGFLLNSSDLGGIGGQLFSASVCPGGAWGSTTFASGIVYVPCVNGLHALALQTGAHPSFTSLWNTTGFFAGPPIVAGGAVWTFDIYNGTLFALSPLTGATIAKISVLPDNSLAHFATPSVGYGFLLFAGDDTVYAVDPSSEGTG